MPTITWGQPFACCLQAAISGLTPGDELLVVFDGPPSEQPAWLVASAATVLHTGQRCGPAAARNLAASKARGEILLFVDADVELHPDAIARMRRQFGADPGLQALFGSYDDRPAAPGVVSRFRNLLHHHTHTSQPGPACTFWAGCGAVRRTRFLELGGFDAVTYHRPCIEDIEFGLRLHDDGGKILLDPTIQGTHHKRWTLGTMVSTDIFQRAIPWSHLLLSRGKIPSTLNISASARISAGLSLVVPLALAATTLPMLTPWPALIAIGALTVVLFLNRSFLGLLLRQGGIMLAAPGAALQLLYLIYSSLSLAAVVIMDFFSRPLRYPAWLKNNPNRGSQLLWVAVVIMGVWNIHTLGRGSVNLLSGGDTGWDIKQRYDEWLLFRDQIYPHASLASDAENSLPYFRTTVYLPWALPMFAGLFAWGGLMQGKILMLMANLAGIATIAFVGKHCFRPWGKAASWFGAFLPLTIRGLNLCLTLGQFSAACVGLLTLQWLLLQRQKPLPAGLCWALAMIKPQIAAPFALSLLLPQYRKGLWLGSGILTGLSVVALWHTGTQPVHFLVSWLEALDYFTDGSLSLTGIFYALSKGRLGSFAIVLIVILGAIAASTYLALRQTKSIGKLWARLMQASISMELAGISAIAGATLFYHGYYDNIMLYPALLCCWLITFERPTLGNTILTILITVSLCAPVSLFLGLPGYQMFQVLTWLAAGMALLLRIASGQAASSPLARRTRAFTPPLATPDRLGSSRSAQRS
ncbi:MAG: glycosyltransferase [Synechococcus sp.]|nr:glycosyltransferase [Synechococcus sp.]